jgi:hypothetical protein
MPLAACEILAAPCDDMTVICFSNIAHNHFLTSGFARQTCIAPEFGADKYSERNDLAILLLSIKLRKR